MSMKIWPKRFFVLATFCLTGLFVSPTIAQNTKFSDFGDLGYQRNASARDVTYEEIKATPALMAPNDLIRLPLYPRGAPGTAILDYDGDGDLDVYISNGPGRANSLYQNQLKQTGNTTFIDVAESAGVALTDLDCQAVCFGDIDNDGDLDLYVTAYQSPNTLLENNGDGTFNDISEASGTNESERNPSSVAMGDVNGDGLLDIYIGNFASWENQLAALVQVFNANEHNTLYLNKGNNIFEDVSASSGIMVLAGFPEQAAGAAAPTNTVAMVDYDMDGDLDLFASDDQGGIPSTAVGGLDRGFMQLHQNDGSGNFTNVSEEAGLLIAGNWMGYAFGDFNGDGAMDFFNSNLGNYFIQFAHANPVPGLFGSRWFLGNKSGGNFVFEDVALNVNSTFGWGCAASDFDNDGDVDIVYHGGIDTGTWVDLSNPGVMLINDGNANFQHDPEAFSVNHSRRSVRAVAFGDLDNNGFPDVVSVSSFDAQASVPLNLYPVPLGHTLDATAFNVTTFAFTNTPGEFAYFGPPRMADGSVVFDMNEGNGNNYVRVKLVGSIGHTEHGAVNRSGIGAIIRFTPAGGKPAMLPVTGGSSMASQHSLEKTFGMGDAEYGTLDVFWPGGVWNRLNRVRAGEEVLIPEIPFSFKDKSLTFRGYARNVRDALKDIDNAGVIDNEQRKRLYYSALLAFYNENLGYKSN